MGLGVFLGGRFSTNRPRLTELKQRISFALSVSALYAFSAVKSSGFADFGFGPFSPIRLIP
jgi:hypothetical protein